MVACALLGAGQAWAQTDVFKDITTGKITNPSFEGNGNTVSDTDQGNKITGWAFTQSNGRVAVFNSSSTDDTYGTSLPSEGSYYVRIRTAGGSSADPQTLTSASAFSVQKGTYRISFDYKAAKVHGYAKKFTVSAMDGNTSLGAKQNSINQVTKNSSYFSNIEWTTDNFSFSLTGTKDVKIKIVCEGSSNSAGRTVLALDNFVLGWNLTQSLKDLITEANTFLTDEDDSEGISYTALKSSIDAADAAKESSDAQTLETQYDALTAALDLAKNHRKPWLTAKTAAEAAIANTTDYDNVVGEEKTNLQSAIAADEPSDSDEYDTAKSDLETKTSAFIGAKDNYDALVAEIAKAKALGISDATADGYAANSSSTSESVVTSTKNLKVAEYTLVSTTYTEPLTLAESDWVATTIKTETKSEHWDDATTSYKASDGWDASSWNCSYSQTFELPAGDYVFKVAGRRSENSVMWIEVKNSETTLGNVNDFPKATSGLGINISGETDFTTGDGHTYANSGNGRGWEWRYIKFTLAEKATITVAIKGSAGTNHQWINFTSYTVLADNALNVSLYEYFKVLNAATAARDNATYTNIDGKEKADLLAAIAVDESLDKSSKTDVDAATTALVDALTAFTDADAVTNYNALATAINTAQAIVDANKNVGSGVFQIPTSAQTTLSGAITTASGIKSNASKTKDDAPDATTTLNDAITAYNSVELNAPDVATRYVLTFHCDGHGSDGNAITLIHNGRNDAGLYGIKYLTATNTNYAQAFKFTATATKNQYYLSQIDADGNERYLTTDKLAYNTSSGNASGIRTTTSEDASIYLPIEVQSSEVDGQFYLINTTTSGKLAHNGNSNNDMYTNNSATFSIAEASQATVDLNIASTTRFATRIFPFSVISLPSGMEAYTCSEVGDGNILTLASADVPLAANTPYILYMKEGNESNISGWGTAKADTYTTGLLTGVYTSTTATAGTYVMQKNDGKVGFYEVQKDEEPTIGAYRAYLTIPNAGARAFFFGIEDGETTAIETLNVLTNEAVTIYNASGVQVPSLQKGMNIIKTSDGKTRKVIVK